MFGLHSSLLARKMNMEVDLRVLGRVLIVIFILTKAILAHPQCLDFRPPFNAERRLTFCSRYSDFGCCTGTNDNDLQREYQQIQQRVNPSLWNRCSGYVKELLCQKCSPYAAHIFDAEQSLQARPFPGLCNNYCNLFYQSCRDIIPYMSRDSALISAAKASQYDFCHYIHLSDVDYCYPDLLSNNMLNNRISQVTINSENCLCLETFASNLRNPVFARHAGDGSQRLFVGEVAGKVYIYYLNGTKESEPFLNMQTKVLNTDGNGDERGFLGMTFHPDFKNNQKFYIYYSTHNQGFTDDDHRIRISELTVNRYDKNKADLNSEKVLLEVSQPYWNHNGGEILFGDDGYLYAFIGDGGAAGDPQFNAQNMSTLLGKIIRIDVNVDYPSQRYKIPPDNPFRNLNNTQPEIFAYGVRNIWRCGKDRGDPVTGEGKGQILCGDVGQNKYEEIDIVKKGVNYGWNGREGKECFNSLCGKLGQEEFPIHVYNHSVGKSITGGHFYRGCHSPNLNGYYFFGDFMNGKLFRLLKDKATGKWNSKELYMCKSDRCTYPLQNNYEPHIISFGEDEDGEVYMLSTGYASSASPLGYVYKIVDPSRRGNPSNCRSARHPTDDSKRVETGQTGTGFPGSTSNPTRTLIVPQTTPSQKTSVNSRVRINSRGESRYTLRIHGIRMRLCKNRRRNTLCRTYNFVH